MTPMGTAATHITCRTIAWIAVLEWKNEGIAVEVGQKPVLQKTKGNKQDIYIYSNITLKKTQKNSSQWPSGVH